MLIYFAYSIETNDNTNDSQMINKVTTLLNMFQSSLRFSGWLLSRVGRGPGLGRRYPCLLCAQLAGLGLSFILLFLILCTEERTPLVSIRCFKSRREKQVTVPVFPQSVSLFLLTCGPQTRSHFPAPVSRGTELR